MQIKTILVHRLFKNKNRINYKLNSAEEISEYHFTFTGEFGYEVLVWIPYLNFLSHTLNIKFHIICKKGLEDLYENLAASISFLERRNIGDGFGDIKKQQFKNKKIFTINEQCIALNKNIEVAGIPFLNKDIHKTINQKFYRIPIIPIQNLETIHRIVDEKIVVINNKQHFNWNGELRNFYTADELAKIFNLLTLKGYKIIYNDPNRLVYDPSSVNTNQSDSAKIDKLISRNKNITDLNALDNEDILLRNRLQFILWDKAEFIIGVHGGSVYIPAFLGKKQYIVFKSGNYFDFIELARITSTKINCHYEVENLLLDLENNE